VSKKILIVQDHPDVRRVLTLNLRHLGYEIVGANTGSSGIAQTVSENPDLVLVDLSLPNVSGLEIAKVINKIHGQRRYLSSHFLAIANER
jgi:CheY-like chemotaxis protein